MRSTKNFQMGARFFAPLPEDQKAKRLDSEVLGDGVSRYLEVYNQNIDMLNRILYGPQD